MCASKLRSAGSAAGVHSSLAQDRHTYPPTRPFLGTGVVGLLAGLAMLIVIVPAIVMFRSEPQPALPAPVDSTTPLASLSLGSDFLHVDDAFRTGMSLSDGDKLSVDFVVAPGYYLYRKQMRISVDDNGSLQPLTNIAMPDGELKTDEYFGESVVFRGEFSLDAVIGNAVLVDSADRSSDSAGKPLKLWLRYQGCADDGICYPPVDKLVVVPRSN